jgi:hypothetical protein
LIFDVVQRTNVWMIQAADCPGTRAQNRVSEWNLRRDGREES